MTDAANVTDTANAVDAANVADAVNMNSAPNDTAAEKHTLTDVVKIEFLDAANAEFTVKNGYIGLRLDRPAPEDNADAERKEADNAASAKDTDNADGSASAGGNAADKVDAGDSAQADAPAATATADNAKHDAPASPAEPPKKEEKPYRVAADGRLEYDRVFLHRCFPNELSEGYISVLDREGSELGMIRALGDFPEETQALLRLELGRKYHFFTICSVRSVNEKYGYSYWKITDDAGEREFTVRDTYRSITKVSEDRVFITDVDGNRFEIPSLAALDRRSRRKIELFL